MARKCVSYLRVSGASQVQGDGFIRQRHAIEHYAKISDLKIVGEFQDEGVSGTNELENRPGLQQLMQRIAGNGVRIVLVEHADRLARKLLVQETILEKLRGLGVSVIASDGTDLTVEDGDPTRKLIRQILGAVAEFEKSMIVAKLGTARRRIRSRGDRCDGRKPFGHREGEAETLERIRRLRRKSRGKVALTYDAIADLLNRENRPTRQGGCWTRGNVYAVCKHLKQGKKPAKS